MGAIKVIISIISSLVVITAVFLGEYLTSLVFGSVKGFKQLITELILFLIVLNMFLYSIIIADDILVQLFVYFLVSFVSIIVSKTIVFLIFKTLPEKVFYKRKEFNSSLILLAKLLNKKLSRSDVIKLFRKAKFSPALIEHLEAVLKD